MKSANGIVVLALGVLCAAIVFLAVRNDVRFNEQRKEEVGRKDSLDSVTRTQADSLMVILNNVTDQLDSIRYVQDEHSDIMKRNIDSIKSSHEYITGIKQQRIDSKK